MNEDQQAKTPLRPGARILVMTAVMAEQEAVLRGLQGADLFDVCLAGVGPVSAAVQTTKALVNKQYDLVLSAGIGGGFPNVAEVGSLVVANQIVAADLGAETLTGFSNLDELGFGSARVPVEQSLVTLVTDALQKAGLPVRTGAALTVSTVTGTKKTAEDRASREPAAAAEGMEGYGVAVAAQEFGLPVLEIRAISNPVGPRDRGAWRIKEALDVLQAASSVLLEVFK